MSIRVLQLPRSVARHRVGAASSFASSEEDNNHDDGDNDEEEDGDPNGCSLSARDATRCYYYVFYNKKLKKRTLLINAAFYT